MRHNVQPLAVPRQDARPHLVALQGGDFFAEAAEDGAQAEAEGALDHVAILVADELVLGVVGDDGDRGAEEVRDGVAAGDVEVGKVGRVALVDVVVGFQEGGARGGDAVVEEGALGEGFGAFEDVVEERVEDADLLVLN